MSSVLSSFSLPLGSAIKPYKIQDINSIRRSRLRLTSIKISRSKGGMLNSAQQMTAKQQNKAVSCKAECSSQFRYQCIAISWLWWKYLASSSQRQEIIWLFSLTEEGKIHLNFHRSHPFTNSQGLEIGRTISSKFRRPQESWRRGRGRHSPHELGIWVSARGTMSSNVASRICTRKPRRVKTQQPYTTPVSDQCCQTLHPELAHGNQWQQNNTTQPPLVDIHLQ